MSPITEAMKPSRNSDRQSCASSGELFPKNGTAFATESPTTFVSSRPPTFGSSRRAGIANKKRHPFLVGEELDALNDLIPKLVKQLENRRNDLMARLSEDKILGFV